MKSRFLGGILLVAGTAIGAGMLALPVLTGMAGFVPSLLLLIAVWLGTVFTALLVLEVNLWFEGDVNLISMVKKTLGKPWASLTWIAFLLLLYSLTAAYLAGSGSIVGEALTSLFHVNIPRGVEPFPFLFLVSMLIYFGIKPIDLFNRLLMIGLVLSYIGLMIWIAPHMELSRLTYSAPSYLWAAVPVVVTSFGFHIIIPNLTSYLKKDVKALKKVIIIGSATPLVIYILWELTILAVMPLKGEHSILQAFLQGDPATQPLALLLNNLWIATFARLFSFFAIITSFLGVSLALSSFLSDGLKIRRDRQGRLVVILLTFLPPLLFVMTYQRGFILALQYAGVFVAIISGILPALMVWKGRALHQKQALYQAGGGRFALALTIFFSLMIIALQIILELLPGQN